MRENHMRTDDLDYHLPEELIALRPAEHRCEARLLVVRSRELVHRSVRDLPKLLRAGDLLVFNDTRVLPARLELRRSRTGGRVEALFLGPASGGEGRWRLMLKSGG
ncbi:MAG: S-adenosylmethionine:tRNA ribosyltransferase-isomerase, partial [Phycisphaeraceae bacterium]|nr:S-adenosylmethionine:tRNA ribosyltransferase-isomerase [Phycisphaeraceae bacterium]